MKLVKFRHRHTVQWGVLQPGNAARVLKAPPFGGVTEPGDDIVDLAEAEILVPTVDRPRVFGVGFNYKAHILETGRPLPSMPPIFMKPDTSLLGHRGKIVYPRIAQLVHYEAELVAVIGRPARNVPAAQALPYVLGYTCGNDVSERTIQRQEMAMGLMTIGKGFDTFAPVGPWIETELDPSDLRMTGRLNGKLVQDCRTSDLLFGVGALVEYLSAAITLLPGDLIMTGTPAGIGPLHAGDTFDVEIEGIGVLSNTVVGEAEAAA